MFDAAADNGSLRSKLRKVEAELAQLRKQSAREREAWKAVRAQAVLGVRSLPGIDGRCEPIYWADYSGGHGPKHSDPVDAVLAVVKAAKQEAGTEPAAATERTTKHGR